MPDQPNEETFPIPVYRYRSTQHMREDMIRNPYLAFVEEINGSIKDNELEGAIPAKEALLIARERLEREYNQRHNQEIPSDNRESEYLGLVLQEKKQDSTRRIIESEEPICIEWVDHYTLEKILAEGHPDIYQGSNTRIVKCSTCTQEIQPHYAFFCAGRLFCAEHVPNLEMCSVCFHVKSNTKPVTTFDKTEINVCKNCLRSRGSCGDCGDRISEEEVVVRQCAKCRNNRANSFPMREWSSSITYAEESAMGKIMQSSRVFSAELEMLIPQPLIELLSMKLPKEVGVGTDGSVHGDGVGIELQTPRLSDIKGEELVALVCEQAVSNRGTINESCGFHVHLDGKGILPKSRKEPPTALMALWKTHTAFEDVILSLVPFGRRLSRFSRPMRPYFTRVELDAVSTIYDAEKLWYRQSSPGELRDSKVHHYHSSRYFGVNFHPLFSQGHFEVRYHPGTLNARKVLEWANLHALIVDAAVEGKFNSTFLRVADNTFSLNDKTNLLFDAIGLSEGSRTYFYERQRKFRKVDNEEETILTNKQH